MKMSPREICAWMELAEDEKSRNAAAAMMHNFIAARADQKSVEREIKRLVR